MRTKRFLLVTAALSTAATATVACGKKNDAGETLPLPANPKGSFYDANVEPPPPADAGTTTPPPPPPPPPPPDAGAASVPTRVPLPANPKGSHYDSGPKKPPAQ